MTTLLGNLNMNVKYGVPKNIVLFCNARDEKHIREWIIHHLQIGFSKIIIFDHKSKVPIKDYIPNLPKRVSVINVSTMSGAIKIPLMNRAKDMAKKMNADWMIYLDADEYIILHPSIRSIRQFLYKYNHAHSLGVNWLMYGSNELKKDPNETLLGSYTKSELLVNKHVKSFVRPKEVNFSNNPHFYFIRQKSKYFGVNNLILNKPFFNDIRIPYFRCPCYIAHFVNQSEETYNKRRLTLPRDDNGQLRENVMNTENLHKQFNNETNNYAKKIYNEKNKLILSKFGFTF